MAAEKGGLRSGPGMFTALAEASDSMKSMKVHERMFGTALHNQYSRPSSESCPVFGGLVSPSMKGRECPSFWIMPQSRDAAAPACCKGARLCQRAFYDERVGGFVVLSLAVGVPEQRGVHRRREREPVSRLAVLDACGYGFSLGRGRRRGGFCPFVLDSGETPVGFVAPGIVGGLASGDDLNSLREAVYPVLQPVEPPLKPVKPRLQSAI